MPLTSAQYTLLENMCPVSRKLELAKLLDRACGTLTVSAANGQGTISVPSDWGTNYAVVGLVLTDGPTAAVGVRVTDKSAGSCTVVVIDSTGAGVDCSTTNATVDYLIVRTG